MRRRVMFAENKANIKSNVIRDEASMIIFDIIRGGGISLRKNY